MEVCEHGGGPGSDGHTLIHEVFTIALGQSPSRVLGQSLLVNGL